MSLGLLERLRQKMQELGIDAYFIPHNDPHNSEYLADRDSRMEFLCGFKGSNGQMLVT